MAVYKSRRKDAAAQFVADARELRKATVRIARKFPASYKYVTTGPLLQLASEVYMNALKGNSIYVHKDMSERDYELRQTTQVREVMRPANRAPDRTLYGWDTALEAT